MELDLNFGKVGYVPPEGNYVLTITKVEVKDAKDKQSKNLIVDFRVEEGPEDEAIGYEFKQWLNLGQNSLWKVQEFLEATLNQDFREDSMKLDPTELPGNTVQAICTVTEYQGRANLSVDSFVRP